MEFYRATDRVPVRVTAVAAVALGVFAPAWAGTEDQAPASVPAVWTPKELRFTYMGFTARYSCDGLRDKMQVVLTKLGARKDMQVAALPCPGPLGRPTDFPGVTLKINVLQPASGQSGADAHTVQAHWQRVDLAPYPDVVRAAGDCELVEQIKQYVLPLFSTRNVEYSSTCVPNQLTIGGTKLKADVLVSDQSSAKATPAN
jgi:hypothetical protein